MNVIRETTDTLIFNETPLFVKVDEAKNKKLLFISLVIIVFLIVTIALIFQAKDILSEAYVPVAAKPPFLILYN